MICDVDSLTSCCGWISNIPFIPQVRLFSIFLAETKEPSDVEKIIQRYGSLDEFVEREFLGNGKITNLRSADTLMTTYDPVADLSG